MPSAFQALRSLRQLSLDECERYPQVLNFSEENMYVDDIFFGADSVGESIFLAHQIYDFLMAGGLPLRKWGANDQRLLAHLLSEWLAEEPVNSSLVSESHMLLGLVWNPAADNFSYSVGFPEISKPIQNAKCYPFLLSSMTL